MNAPTIILDDELIRPDHDDVGIGLLTCERGWLPLTAVDIDGTVSGLDAAITVRQSFVNPLSTAIEATYIHPLPDRAAVTRFVMTVGDRRIEGLLKERGEARATYDQALVDGHRAAIAEEERPDVFTTRVGNLQPGERADIELTLAQPLPWEDGRTQFRFPLVVARRFVPGRPLDGAQVGDGTGFDTDAVPDASRISPPVLLPGLPNPVRLGMRLTFPDGVPDGIASGLHGVATDATTVALHPGERLDRDVVVRWPVVVPDGFALATLTPDPDTETDPKHGADTNADADADPQTGTATIVVHPPEGPDRPRPRDVVLVLDRSGSMGGWKMVAARRAAARMVDSLHPDDRFAVLAFDQVIERPTGLPDGLAAGTNRHRWLAVEWLAGLEARGGTEMVQPLTEAIDLVSDHDRPGDSERDAICLLVTDGQVANEDQLLAALAPRLGGTTMFTIGIDRAVNAGFLNRLAAQGGGRCELVESEERLDDVLLAIQRRISTPALRSVTVEAEGGTLEDITGTGDCFAGVPLILRARYRGPVTAIRWQAEGAEGSTVGDEAATVAVVDPAARPLWARARIRDLEDRYAGGGHLHSPGQERLADEIVALSVATGVLSRFTAFVAVDRSETVDATDRQATIQPVERPSGWGGPPPLGAVAPPSAAPMAAGSAPGAPLPMSVPMSGPMPMSMPPAYGAPAPAGSAPTDRSRRSKRPGGARSAPAVPTPPTSIVPGFSPATLDEIERLLARIRDGETGRGMRRELRALVKRLEGTVFGRNPLLAAMRELARSLGSRRGHAAELRRVEQEVDQARAPHPTLVPVVPPAAPAAPRTRRQFWR